MRNAVYNKAANKEMPFIIRQPLRDVVHNKAANKEMPFIIRQPLRNAVHNKAGNKEKPLKTRQGWEFAHLISKQIACFFCQKMSE